ncbi:hypothetical protein TUM4438_05440 [Shewanella sairae]|uniref:N-acetyltransferase domain-containing protein n=1 Tax=Shewanella sairae TaxID=190310 RepID=A0ABQ4P1M2_9GAMM|nr:GNAT family N-acetyltransferase [Shewanella sairae]MCL1129700.1 GNAT family N-acetyltransferase [Shewanella sairae]GIU41389.1 hypothetical protein TUM4438_05440 [Shewanella sairae]
MANSAHQFETERLSMRLLDERDKDLYAQIYTDEKIMRKISAPLSVEKAQKSFAIALKKNAQPQSPFLTWVITNKTTNETIGIQGLTQHKEQPAFADVGIMLLRNAQGKLLPEESISGLFYYAFSKLNYLRIYAHYSKTNYATHRVTQKMGFTPTSSSTAESNACFLDSKWLEKQEHTQPLYNSNTSS